MKQTMVSISRFKDRLVTVGSEDTHGWYVGSISAYLVPERKVMFRPNPNVEYRNPKQTRIPNDKMIETNPLKTLCFCH